MTDTTREPSGSNPPLSNVPDSLIVYHSSEVSKLDAELLIAKAAHDAVKGKMKTYRKTIQADGITLKNFDASRAMLLADPDQVAMDMAEQGRYLRAFNSPLGYQFDMFDQPNLADQAERWHGDGFRAGAKADGRDENPHAHGDKGHRAWDDGWLDAQKVIVAGMEISKSAQEPEEEEDDGDDDQPALASEPANDAAADEMDDGEPDWHKERDAGDPPVDEESALKGVEG